MGSYATVRQDQDYIEYKNIFDQVKCVRDNGAVCDVLASQAQTIDRHEKLPMHGTKRRSGVQGESKLEILQAPILRCRWPWLIIWRVPFQRKLCAKQTRLPKLLANLGEASNTLRRGKQKQLQVIIMVKKFHAHPLAPCQH